MSHYTCLVIGEDPAAMLAPFDENLEVPEYREYEDGDPAGHWAYARLLQDGAITAEPDWAAYAQAHNSAYPDHHGEQLYASGDGRGYTLSTRNPRSKWDWHALGGRWRGFFLLRDTLKYPGGVVLAEPHWGEERSGKTVPAGQADAARKCDIDFAGMQAIAAAEAVTLHAKVRQALAGHPDLIQFSRYRDELFAGDIEKARAAYNAQPGLDALRAAGLDPWDDPVETYCLEEAHPAAAYLARRRERAISAFALLTAEGWAERGSMGWFGVVTGENEQYPALAARVIAAAPEDALFSLFDLHI